VLDYGFDDERQPYFTMMLLENASNILDAGMGQPVEVRVHLLVQILQALAYLHRRGIIHRDLKPGNILVVGDQVKLLDFGLSSVQGQGYGIAPGTTSGTIAYLAPEALNEGQISEASDLYAVGMI